MKTNQPGLETVPPRLKRAIEEICLELPGGYNCDPQWVCDMLRDKGAAIIARHDEGRTDSPALRLEKNKHAATLRLLEDAKEYLHDLRGEWSWKEGAGTRNTKALADLDSIIEAIRAHLAAPSKPAATKEATDCEGCIHRHYVTPDPMGTSRLGWGCLLSGGHATKRCAGYTTHAMKGTQ